MSERFLLTGGEATSEEHVEEVLGGDVGLEAPMEVETPPVRVTWAAGLLASHHIILPPLVRVAQHSIRVADLFREDTHKHTHTTNVL